MDLIPDFPETGLLIQFVCLGNTKDKIVLF